jgi:hypothetical protein
MRENRNAARHWPEPPPAEPPLDFRPPHVREIAIDQRNTSGENFTIRMDEIEAKLEAELGEPPPLEQMRTLMRSLTYGEMIELASGLWHANQGGGTITEESLPAILHRWAMVASHE